MQDDYTDEQTGSKVLVHTGFPNPAIDASLQSLDLNRLLISHGASTYFMRIAGNDWQRLGIFSGDIAIIDKALSAHTNDLVIWWHAGNFVISEFGRVAKGGQIWGVVTSVIHQFRSRI